MRPARSYGPIRCQEPQWPRRPLAIGRRGLPLTRPGPPRHVVGAFGSVSYPRIPFCRPALHSFGGGSPSLSTRMRRPPRAQRERGYPRRLPGRRDGGYVYSPASLHIVPRAQPPHELGGGGGVRLRLGHAPLEHPRAAGAGARTPSSRASLSRAGLRSPASAWAGARPGRSARTPRPPAS